MLRDTCGTGWICAASTADDVEHPVGQETDGLDVDLDDDDDMHRRGVGQALAESAAQIDDRHHDAAQVEHAAHIVGLIRRSVTPDQPLISRTAMMSTPYCSSPMAKLMNSVATARAPPPSRSFRTGAPAGASSAGRIGG